MKNFERKLREILLQSNSLLIDSYLRQAKAHNRVPFELNYVGDFFLKGRHELKIQVFQIFLMNETLLFSTHVSVFYFFFQ